MAFIIYKRNEAGRERTGYLSPSLSLLLVKTDRVYLAFTLEKRMFLRRAKGSKALTANLLKPENARGLTALPAKANFHFYFYL